MDVADSLAERVLSPPLTSVQLRHLREAGAASGGRAHSAASRSSFHLLAIAWHGVAKHLSSDLIAIAWHGVAVAWPVRARSPLVPRPSRSFPGNYYSFLHSKWHVPLPPLLQSIGGGVAVPTRGLYLPPLPFSHYTQPWPCCFKHHWLAASLATPAQQATAGCTLCIKLGSSAQYRPVLSPLTTAWLANK